MNKDLAALYALQQVDSRLALAVRQYQALDPGRAEQAAAETARTLHERLERTLHETETDLRDAELELKTIEKKKKDEENRLYSGKVQAPKELQAITEEIASLGRHQGQLDERILTLMEQAETRRAEEQEAAASRRTAEEALAAKQASYKKAARELALQIKALQAEREELAKPVPPGLLKRYDAIRARSGGVGIAAIEDGRCGGCHTSISTFQITRVEEGGTETCENCSRLLTVDV